MQSNIFSGLFVGQNFIVLKQVNSTNTYLKELLSNSKPVAEGTVIMAEDQFAGRGQQSNVWHAEPGKNLTFSLLLNPTFLPVVKQFDLVMTMSLAVVNALETATGLSIEVKWPNDIYTGGKKLGGMLIENVIQGSTIKHSVVGIGLNVNQEQFGPNAGNAVSIKNLLQRDCHLQQLLSEICRHIEAGYLQLKAGRANGIKNQYLAKLYRFGKLAKYRTGDEVFEGTITGVRADGFLLMDTPGGPKAFNLKEVQFLND